MEQMNPNFLLVKELNYELRIRGSVTERDVGDKRKILRRLLKTDNSRKLDFVDPDYEYTLEVKEIEESFKSVTELVEEFEGSSEDSMYKRIRSRLLHLSGRVARIRIPETGDVETVKKFRNETSASILLLEADVDEKLSQRSQLENAMSQSMTQSSSTIQGAANNLISNGAVIRGQREVPVYKWGVSFDGDTSGSSINAFLVRVEELAEARHVSKNELFDSAVDLFAGKALIWFRSIKPRVKDWDSLVALLKKEFLPADYDDQLWEELKLRVQGRNESCSMYIAMMLTLFSRLSRPTCEKTRVKQIKKNLLPVYVTQLALSEIDTVEELSKLCRKLEEVEIAKRNYRAPAKPACALLEPELAYVSRGEMSDFRGRSSNPLEAASSTEKSASERKKPSNLRNSKTSNNFSRDRGNTYHSARDGAARKHHATALATISCWNCSQLNHTYQHCTQKRSKFCFKCGQKNVTVASCARCSGNDKGDTVK